VVVSFSELDISLYCAKNFCADGWNCCGGPMSIVVSVENVSREFRKYYQRTFKEFLTDRHAKNFNKVFMALDNISFQVKDGSTLGLLGRNGSGKSTLLKIISGVLTPSSGQVTRPVSTAALLELGAGFQPEMTGRENIFLNSSILGRSKKDTELVIDDIIDFSGISEFIDTPVKFYSSGMYARLGFAIAIHTDPELLLVDEILAVGDAPFQKKCLDRIKEMQNEGRSIILVTHDVATIQNFCDSAVVLDKGKLIAQGSTKDALDVYHKLP
jgi:ABC-2 type transport system ATP-binding protein